MSFPAILRRSAGVIALVATLSVLSLVTLSSAAPVEVIVDNGGSGSSIQSGYWYGATAASQHYGSLSLYSTVGGSVDTYRFTPNLPEAGVYEVSAWNSCYNNRPTDVPHRIVHSAGTTVVDVDQDCDTGSHGEWFVLGTFAFSQGQNGYVEITDAGISYSGTTYIGADAVRFYKDGDDTTAPTVSMTSPANGATVSGTISLAADASDDSAVVGVQFTVDGSNHGAEDTTSPYSVSLDTTTLSDGSHTVSAVARDAANNTATATTVTIDVDNSVPPNSPPVLNVPVTSLTVDENDTVSLNATASDTEDGDLTGSIQWSSTDGNSGTGGNLSFTAIESATITVSVADSGSAGDSELIALTVNPLQQTTTVENFGCDTESALVGFTTNNASALPDVWQKCGRYYAELTSNTNNVTLHFHGDQGRFDGKLVSFPFEVVARNVGIGTLANSQLAPGSTGSEYIFSGIQVHVEDLTSPNSAHVVVGHRGGAPFTIEGKTTVSGSSAVNDAGANIVPDGRADIRIVGNADKTLTVYWQEPNSFPDSQSDSWTLYNGTGTLPGSLPTFGDNVYVGLITYAFEQAGVPFVGTADRLEITQ